MTDAAEQQLIETVVESFVGAPDPRLREIVTALTRHLHAFAREVRLTEDEWAAGVEFLTATGRITDHRRQEFVLLSDVLGLSMQTVTINHDTHDGATEATVLGPFFLEGAPVVEDGGDLAAGAPGEPCWVEGVLRSADGTPIAGARVDVWEADDDGRYDTQYADNRTAARGAVITAADGSFRFWALTPTPYPIPSDGPVGQLLTATGRSPMRAPHLHFRIVEPGYDPLITHLFVAGEDLGYDSVFGIRPSLVRDFVRHTGPTPDGREIEGSWTRVDADLVLAPSSSRRR